MCTDYTNLNKACPKDAYPLPNIDRLVDGASGHNMLTFLDAYSGYNQIQMHPHDEEKTVFITDSANYCYRESESRYQLLEKVALGLVHTARRLRQYFQGHKIVVRIDCPIAKVLRKPELAGRMMAWSIELSEFDISFEPRGPIKSHYWAEFINELQPNGQFQSDQWTMHVDGSSNNTSSGAGIILEGPMGVTLEQSMLRASNNQVEYEALLAGVRLVGDIGVRRLIYWTDSQIVSEQVNNHFQVKDPNLLRYYHMFHNMCSNFDEVQVRHTPRENNERADQLARLVSSARKPGQLRTTLHLELPTPSITSTKSMIVEETSSIASNATWITELLDFIVHGKEPAKPLSAKKLRTQAARYSVIGGELYRRGFSTPLLKCLDSAQADYVLREIHQGICGSHSGGQTLTAKVLRAGYYWPTLKSDCAQFVKRCVQCQKHGNLIHASAEQLHSISSPWPFALWGMDLLGPFPIAKGQCKFLLVAVDYFTKWIEAEPLATITHPQSNGQAEAANKVILTELKKRLGDAKGAWVEELLEVLWAYRCTPQSTTRETLFCLTYGTDAMILVEVGEPSFRRTHFDESSNEDSIRAKIDTVEETRNQAQVVAEACR
ncbi:uncharacterized protein LOC109800307 [Cajanus cajan]|uniref:uncharacterized protein LOC109800307 n=1 Tax=Cajanus cajan TaxID=3821 RepID=UPI00098D7CE6|nr:uncharacterized protein LOC109800307 [Cajanus cajan]